MLEGNWFKLIHVNGCTQAIYNEWGCNYTASFCLDL